MAARALRLPRQAISHNLKVWACCPFLPFPTMKACSTSLQLGMRTCKADVVTLLSFLFVDCGIIVWKGGFVQLECEV